MRSDHLHATAKEKRLRRVAELGKYVCRKLLDTRITGILKDDLPYYAQLTFFGLESSTMYCSNPDIEPKLLEVMSNMTVDERFSCCWPKSDDNHVIALAVDLSTWWEAHKEIE